MRTRAETGTFGERLLPAIDWFVPAELRTNTATHWQGRIFVISHLVGPFSGVVIFGYLYSVLATADWALWTMCALCASFWLLPFVLRRTGRLFEPALHSFCTLTTISVVGAFNYGGVSSPFMPWFLTAQMLGFFYLSDRPRLVLGWIAASLGAFALAYLLAGEFPHRVPLHELSTVGMISACAATLYNSMMAIYYAYVMIENSALQCEIKKHAETQVKLNAAKSEAERANDAKAVFLAKMSHQLRTPLNAIIGYSELLIEDAEASSTDEDVTELRSINNAGRHLLSLVSDVLEMPKIDSDEVDIHLGPVDLDHCLEEVTATCRHLISQNGNTFALDTDGPLGVIQSDETRLRQILINLLGNAGKFTRNGEIVLSARRTLDGARGRVLIAVRDTGVGMAPEAIPQLFKDFSQVDPDAFKGTGLGLAVSQRLARLLDGDISVESRLGLGSKFTLQLPADAPARATAA
ncbi:MAG: hypothetical protein IT178_01410 [Acidobacteria bacterium]|nr:hypothetical protein [Acidobacteriota bacterium]